eukprot:3157789-Amphidinium_carterae.3
MLKWGGNVRAVWASCTRCHLQKVIYADRVGLHEELSGWTPAVRAALATPAARGAPPTPVSGIPKTPGLPVDALPQAPARRVLATPTARGRAAMGGQGQASASSGTLPPTLGAAELPPTPAGVPTTTTAKAATTAPATP